MNISGPLYFATKKVGKAIWDFKMLAEGDKVIIAVSGGKDSLCLLRIMEERAKFIPIHCEMVACFVDMGFSWLDKNILIKHFEDSSIPYIIAKAPDQWKGEGEGFGCFWCSWNRRKALFDLARDIKANKIAFAHHMDDIIETFMLRCFYTGQIGAMAPSRYSNDNKNRVIRPLAYCTSELVNDYFRYLDIEPVAIKCPIRKDSKRELIRDYLKRLETDIPRVKYSLFASLSNIDMKSLCLKVAGHADPH